jgi:hypothetical protein
MVHWREDVRTVLRHVKHGDLGTMGRKAMGRAKRVFDHTWSRAR